MKFLKIFLLTIVVLFSFTGFLQAEDEQPVVHFFDDRLCPVCHDTKEFLEELEKDGLLELKTYPISNTQKLAEVAKEHGVEDYNIMAPSIFIEDNFFQFRDFTSRNERMIEQALAGKKVEDDCCVINIPFLNIEVDTSEWALPLVAVLLGSLDGLNVCSLGALILVLSIVLMFDSRKKIFFFGGLFLLTAVTIYGFLVFIWGQLFELLVGQLEILRIIVGLAALGGGIYFFKEFLRFFKYGPTCQSSDSSLAKKATNKLKQAFEQGQGFLVLVGSIMFFAAVITLVELPCSIGIPIAFTGILVEEGVSLPVYISYILLYLFFYVLIELIIFVGAVLTKQIWFAGSKLITWVTLVGALILFYLALHYLIGL